MYQELPPLEVQDQIDFSITVRDSFSCFPVLF